MKRAAAVFSLCVLVSVAAILLPSHLSAATQSILKLNFFNSVVDEQSGVGCTNPPLVTTPYASGDVTSDPAAVGPNSAYTMAPWTTSYTTLSSVEYANGADCNTSKNTCLAVTMNSSQTSVSLDSRLSRDPMTGKPRAVRLDFSQPCSSCAYGPGPSNPFGTNPFATPGLLSVFLTTPYTSMAVCSSTACPEAETGTVRFWFTDASGTSWRVDWGFVRVLRVAANNWYVLADGCDGSQVGTLYKTKKSSSRLGSYLMPFFISIQQ